MDKMILTIGSPIEVCSVFGWNNGFQIAEISDKGYRVLRVSDNYVLPGEFDPALIRQDSQRLIMWR